MSIPINNLKTGGGFKALSLNGAASTGAGTAMVLKRPCSKWGVETLIAGATEGTVLLEGAAASSAGASFSTIMSITVSTDGETNSTSGFVAKQVRLTLDAMSSSDASVTGWITGAP